MTDLLPGVPVSSSWLAQRGISRHLAYGYVQRGWLQALARGVFAKPGTILDRDASLRLLADLGYRVHVGGRTALTWNGVVHDLAVGGEVLTLYRVGARPLPGWFTSRFPCRTNARRLFDEGPTSPLGMASNDPRHPGVPVSEPERATLEMLAEVPRGQSLEGAEHLMEGLVSLRSEPLRELLTHCINVKTVRLFLHFARKLGLPVLQQLPTTGLPTGSASRYVRKLPYGTLVLGP